MNADPMNLYRKARNVDELPSAYDCGFGWAAINRGSRKAYTVYKYCSDLDEYDLGDADFKKIRNLIHLMVDNKNIFDPDFEYKYYEVAFFMGVIDGVEHYDTLPKPRYNDLLALCSWEESENGPQLDGSSGDESTPLDSLVTEPPVQGSLQ